MKAGDKNKEIEEYRFSIEKMFLSSEHFLDGKSEEILSIFDAPANRSGELYSALTVADGKSKTVKLSDKKEYAVTQGNWRMLIAQSNNAKDRKKICW